MGEKFGIIVTGTYGGDAEKLAASLLPDTELFPAEGDGTFRLASGEAAVAELTAGFETRRSLIFGNENKGRQMVSDSGDTPFAFDGRAFKAFLKGHGMLDDGVGVHPMAGTSTPVDLSACHRRRFMENM